MAAVLAGPCAIRWHRRWCLQAFGNVNGRSLGTAKLVASSKPERYKSKQEADADGRNRALTDKQLFSWYTHELFERFCVVHGVSGLPQYTTLGTPKKTRHACKLQLTLPRELHQRFGNQRLVQRGEVRPKKTDALLSAKEMILRKLRDQGDVNLHDLLHDERRTAVKRVPYNGVHARTLIRRAPEDAKHEVAGSALYIGLLSKAWPVFSRHKTLSKKKGQMLQVNARCYPRGGKSFVAQLMESQSEGADHDSMELQLLTSLPQRLRESAGYEERNDIDRISRNVQSRDVQTRIHAVLEFDSDAVSKISSNMGDDGDDTPAPSGFESAAWSHDSHVPELMDAPPLQLSQSRELPIFAIKEDLQESLMSSRLAVIEGGTGCGKTTQVPQFLLDSADDTVSVLVLQPRRIAAIAAARRVAAELNEDVGVTVGYSVHLDSHPPSRRERRIEFATAGLVLARASRDPGLYGTTHVVFDEHHERNADSDLLLALLKDDPRFKVIVMSATLHSEALLDYLGVETCFRVPLVPNYAVDTKFLGDVPVANKLKDKIRAALEANDTEEFAELVCLATAEAVAWYVDRSAERTKAILCFLPGWSEIEQVATIVEECHGDKCSIFRLHSRVNWREQREALESVPPERASVKIILATDIAETSLTVPDVTLVIDSGLRKTMRYSPTSRVSTLRVEHASKAAAQQRLGRVGRVGPGECWRLYPEPHYRQMMEEYHMPELERINLERYVLRAATLGRPDIFWHSLSPPPVLAVDAGLRRLIAMGALQKSSDTCKETPTQLGHALSSLPVDPNLGRALLLGIALGIADDAATVTALISTAPALDVKGVTGPAGYQMSDTYGSDVVRSLDALAAAEHPNTSVAIRDTLRAKSELVKRTEPLRELVQDRALLDPDHRIALLNCVVCAAFGANLAYAQASSKGRRFCATRTQTRVHVDAASVNAGRLATAGGAMWLAYGDVLDTGTLRLTHTTWVTPLQVALFGGDDHYLSEPLGLCVIDDWIFARPTEEGRVVELEAVRRAIDAMILDLVSGRQPNQAFIDALVSTVVNDAKANRQDSAHIEDDECDLPAVVE